MELLHFNACLVLRFPHWLCNCFLGKFEKTTTYEFVYDVGVKFFSVNLDEANNPTKRLQEVNSVGINRIKFF